MNNSMNAREISERIELSHFTTSAILCRQEFSKYATFHKGRKTRYNTSIEFLLELLNILELKRLSKQADKVKGWLDEYVQILW